MNRVRAGAAAGAACCRRAGLGARRHLPRQLPLALRARFHFDALGFQRRLARGDLPLDALVFGFADGFRFPIFPLDLALQPPFLLPRLVGFDPFGLGLAAPGGRL